MLKHPYSLFLLYVPTLVQQSLRTVWVSLLCEWSAWEKSCLETLPVTEMYPVLRTGHSGQSGLPGTG